MNALTYITRKCPRKCDYCDLSKNIGRELDTKQWVEAFSRLKDIGVEFNLILGNEAWLLGESLVTIINSAKIPYAVYTTCHPMLFQMYAKTYFGDEEGIDNLSCGIDYPYKWLVEFEKQRKQYMTDIHRKSLDAWRGIIQTKATFLRDIDIQGTVTVGRHNFKQLPHIVRDLYNLEAFCGINFIHWNKDGKYDFFPTKDELRKFTFNDKTVKKELQKVLNAVKAMPNTVQNIEMLDVSVDVLTNLTWHCQGDPYGGPTVDANGSLRCCGYRKGERTPKFSIFDLPSKLSDWKEAVYLDAKECPGCIWSYPWMYKYWRDRNPEFGKKIFSVHAGKHIPKSNWSRRKFE